MNPSEGNHYMSLLSNSGTIDEKGLDHLFPIPVDSLKGSVSFAKNFTLLALSVISYSRGMFPNYAYADKKYQGHTIKILNGRGVCEEAQLVWRWMRSACKALEEGYMRELIFEVLSVEDEIVEYYTIEYRYDENNIKCSISAIDKTIAQFDHASFQAAFINLFATIASFVKDLEPLPAVYRLQLRINYYDAKTPENYIPDYFRDESLQSKMNKFLYMSSMGSVKTPFHHVLVKMASNLKRKAEGQSIPSQQSQKRMKGVTRKMSTMDLKRALMSQDSNKENVSHQGNETVEKVHENKTLEHRERNEDYDLLHQPQYLKELECQQNVQHATKGQSGPSIRSGPSSSLQTKSTSTLRKSGSPESNFARVQTNCICNLNDHSRAAFECYHCKKWHHLVCYKRKPTSMFHPNRKYSCAKCALENENLECLDPTMATKNVPMKNIEDLAVYRQVIFRLQWFTLINTKILIKTFRASEEQARSIISKLVKKNILTPCTRSEDYTLNTNQLMAFINSYFK